MSMDLEHKRSLWARLRVDPDFKPEWLLAMGQNPPVEAEEYRLWGDGRTNTREHLIADVSFRAERGGNWIACICGQRMTATRPSTLEDLWDLHRGLSPEAVASARLAYAGVELATDTEVGDFLGRVEAYSKQEGLL